MASISFSEGEFVDVVSKRATRKSKKQQIVPAPATSITVKVVGMQNQDLRLTFSASSVEWWDEVNGALVRYVKLRKSAEQRGRYALVPITEEERENHKRTHRTYGGTFTLYRTAEKGRQGYITLTAARLEHKMPDRKFEKPMAAIATMRKNMLVFELPEVLL